MEAQQEERACSLVQVTAKTRVRSGTKRCKTAGGLASLMTFNLLLLYSSVLASCDGSNLDVEKPTVFREDAAGFGQTVVQFGGSR